MLVDIFGGIGYIVIVLTHVSYIDAYELVSIREVLKSAAVAFANWHSRDSGKDVSNQCERDPSNRTDGQIDNLPRPWEEKIKRTQLVDLVMMIVLIVKLYMTWIFKMNGLVGYGNATSAV